MSCSTPRVSIPVSPSARAQPRRRRRSAAVADWLADFDLAGEELTDELLEGKLIPAARQRVGESRLQTLATMVLLGMNRIVVRDGSISASVRFRAAAKDKTKVDYAVSQDPGDGDVGPARVGDLRHPRR